MYYRRSYRPSYKTSGKRYCASLKLQNGQTIQVNFETPRTLIRAIQSYPATVLKIYEKGN